MLWTLLSIARIGQYSRPRPSVRQEARSATQRRLNFRTGLRGVVTIQRRHGASVAWDHRDIAGTGQDHVTQGDASDATLEGDSLILQQALLTSVAKSPKAFLATTEDLMAKTPLDWARDLGSSAWWSWSNTPWSEAPRS